MPARSDFLCFYGLEAFPEFRLFVFGEMLVRKYKQHIVFFIYMLIQQGNVCTCMLDEIACRLSVTVPISHKGGFHFGDSDHDPAGVL